MARTMLVTPGQPCPRGPAAGTKSQDVYDTVMDLLRTERVKPTDRVGEILKHESDGANDVIGGYQ